MATAQGDRQRGADERDRVPHLERDGAQIDKPDRMVFDLDPGDGVSWPRVQEAATLVHSFLEELGLQAWLKTSGGKGLHVVVPLAPRHDWDTVKGFSQAVVEHLASVVPNRFSAKSGAAKPRRQGLRRLHPQHPRRHHRRGVFGARTARAGRVDAGVVGRAERR